jgi:hypothetical protein
VNANVMASNQALPNHQSADLIEVVIPRHLFARPDSLGPDSLGPDFLELYPRS